MNDEEAEEVRRNSERKKECAAISKKLVEVNRRIKDVAADGHCLYRAIADQSGSTYTSIRETCASFMEAHESDFAPFIEDESFGDHCAKVRSSAEWGGQPELLARAGSERPIVVYSRIARRCAWANSDGEGAVVTTIALLRARRALQLDGAWAIVLCNAPMAYGEQPSGRGLGETIRKLTRQPQRAARPARSRRTQSTQINKSPP